MPSVRKNSEFLKATDPFTDRHIGPRPADIEQMLEMLGFASLDALTDAALPAGIRMTGKLEMDPPRSQQDCLDELRDLADRNHVFRSFIGLGYHDCVVPPAIQRGVLENAGWYTAYTPYQAEIAQGRLEALLNFQTMVSDLTGFEVANASMLDESTAAAEAMTLCQRVTSRTIDGTRFFVSERCHPQTIEVVRTRAKPLGIDVVVGDHESFELTPGTFGALVQYPATDGGVFDYNAFCERMHGGGALVVVATDLLALTLLRSPAEIGADVAVGNSQRFGVPLGYGGPHAAFMSTRKEYQRQMPGRIVGVSKDTDGRPALRLALQTREQHIRRDRATSNICTAQVLLAVMASMYAVYHGRDGLTRIARYVKTMTGILARALTKIGCGVGNDPFFDTLRVTPGSRSQEDVLAVARTRGINLRAYDDGDVGIALGESVTDDDVIDLFEAFGGQAASLDLEELADEVDAEFAAPHARASEFLTHEVFNRYRSETELMRYMHRLEIRDLALNHSMIPLGSCTMKLNAAAEMFPITQPGFAAIHPFAPEDQTQGYGDMLARCGRWLAGITGLPAVSFMPNAGAQGEYAGLLVIAAYHASRGEGGRDVCLIPQSAHGTNPASAILAGMRVVVVACDDDGNIDVADLETKAREHREHLGAIMATYPSTHGVFEASILEICKIVHDNGGQVYLDGANMNAMVGLSRPGDFGADVIHLNLHKTFCIPHGGGGPGMGPICVASHLEAFLPGHPLADTGGAQGIGPVSSAPYGSASIVPISYAYIAMMGEAGLKRATQAAILAANYVARRLEPHYSVLYRGANGLVAHECILDTRPFKQSAGIDFDDIAKRLMDYGFHAPTMSWPVAGTMMIEPTESESLEELDRFCDAMISIREEIREIEEGRADRENNVLKHAPHTARAVAADAWDRPYSRERAAFPAPWLREHKYWPPVGRIDNVYGDRNLMCSCPPLSAYEK